MKPGDEIIWKDSGPVYRHCVLRSIYENPRCVKVIHRGCEWILRSEDVMEMQEYLEGVIGKERQKARTLRGELIGFWEKGIHEPSKLAELLHMHRLAVWNCIQHLKRLELIHENEKAMVE